MNLIIKNNIIKKYRKNNYNYNINLNKTKLIFLVFIIFHNEQQQ